MTVEKPTSKQWAFCSWAITWYKISSLESKWRTRTCWTKEIQIWWLCLSCPRASFALECEDFVPRVSVKRQQKFSHLKLWRHRKSAPVNFSFLPTKKRALRSFCILHFACIFPCARYRSPQFLSAKNLCFGFGSTNHIARNHIDKTVYGPDCFVQRDQRWIIAKLLTCRKVLFWRDVLVCHCRCRSS